MPLQYKKLGNYIREVDVKNTDLKVSLLLGVSITKKFIPSIANIIGTDLSKYKIVRKGQFAYGPVTSRNGDQVSIALLEDNECIISTSYTVFEISKPEELLNEYLMLLFSNPEFDRYARYNSWGSAREIFSWDELCNTELYIPDIEEQKRIVREYQVVEKRIELLGQINEKLYKTMSILYNSYEKVQHTSLISLSNKIYSGKRPSIIKEKITQEYKIPVIGASGINGYTNEYLFDKRVVSTGRVGTIGKIMIWNGYNYFTDNSLIIDTNYVATTSIILKEYNFQEITNGSSNPKITQTDLSNIECSIPSKENILDFEKKANIILNSIEKYTKEISILENIKNNLLINLI